MDLLVRYRPLAFADARFSGRSGETRGQEDSGGTADVLCVITLKLGSVEPRLGNFPGIPISPGLICPGAEGSPVSVATGTGVGA